MWQAKDLQRPDFGSVAKKGVSGEIAEVWQRKELEIVASDEWRVARKGLAADFADVRG